MPLSGTHLSDSAGCLDTIPLDALDGRVHGRLLEECILGVCELDEIVILSRQQQRQRRNGRGKRESVRVGEGGWLGEGHCDETITE